MYNHDILLRNLCRKWAGCPRLFVLIFSGWLAGGTGGTCQAQDEPPPISAQVNFDYFHDQLAPFGTWIDIGGVTYWRPDAAFRANPDWRPYYDLGQWVQTDNGLFWQSDYNWGDIPFHYGRWVKDPGQGWLWLPGYVWGPAWVYWRDSAADLCMGWAPLPPGADCVGGVLQFNGVAVGVDFDFGLDVNCFTFVGYDHFHERFMRLGGREYPYHVRPEFARRYFHHSVISNHFRRDEHGRMVNEGIGRDRLEHVTHNRLEHTGFEERNPVGDRNRPERPREGVPERPGENHERPLPERPAPALNKVYRPPAAPTWKK